jgi:transcriptional regulator with XRE-family HTH domain
MEMADRIRQARNKANLTQRGLASRLKVAPSAVAQWETGGTTPTVGNRAELSRILSIPFIELLPEAGKVGELTIRDPQLLAIVQQLQKLPESLRAAFLMQVAASAEMLEAAPTRPAPAAGKPRR